MADDTAVVRDGMLRYEQDGATVTLAVGSAAWFAWLAGARRFSVEAEGGRVGVCREQAGSGRGGWYWRAYRKQRGRLRRAYLGPDQELTAERLLEAVARLLAPEPEAGTLSAAVSAGSEPEPLPPILAAKVTPPILRPGSVERPALAARLREGSAAALTLLVAPPGFGKTTLLAQCAALPAEGGPVAWLGLDPGDDAPGRFLAALIAALEHARPGVAAGAATLQRRSPPPAPADLLAALAGDLGRLDAPLIAVLDDYHTLRDPAVHQLVALLLDRMPPRLRLVISSRVDPPLPLARLRARGELAELRAEALRFAGAESAALLERASLRLLGAAEVAALEARTEGWAAGLQLAGVAMRGVADVDGFIAGFNGTHRFVMDYLIDEVIAQQPAHLRRFLLETAILERLSGPLCDAVLGPDDALAPAAAPTSQALLEEIERQGLFLIALDQQRRWYRYHQLFAEVLRAELRRSAPPERIAGLHRRAARWYAAHAPDLGPFALESAIGHALAGGETSLLAALLPRLPAGPLRQRVVAALPPDGTDGGVALTAREQEVLRLIADGCSNSEIAERMVVALSTVKAHINHLFGKLSVTSRTQALARARELGLLP